MSGNTSNFRCPFCLDSQKSKTKKRGYFFHYEGEMRFKCHNCSRHHSIPHFLKYFDHSLYVEYLKEMYTREYKKEIINEPQPEFKPKFQKAISPLEGLESVDQLPDDHFAKIYVRNRKIPEDFYKDLFFTDDFKALVDRNLPDNEFTLKTKDRRLVIPFYDPKQRIFAFQGRALLDNSLKYLTIKLKEDARKIYGLNRLDPTEKIYVVEGPIDSMFLPNAIAAGGSDLPKVDGDLTFIFDNEPRNAQNIAKMGKIIKQGHKVCIWPDSLKHKDINDMVMGGMSPEAVKRLIDDHTFYGLIATLKLNTWKRCE